MKTNSKYHDKNQRKIEPSNIIRETQSICFECKSVIPAIIYEKKDKVFISKKCPVHGDSNDLYWGDSKEYARAMKYMNEGVKLDNTRTPKKEGCPFDCGICTEHKSTTVLAIIDVTNRCNLICPICFANAGATGYLYEPSKAQIKEMMENLLSNKPVRTPALQFSGGEPTVREDLPELVEMAMELGFILIQVATNGVKMAESLDYCIELKKAGVSNVYLQFDGVTSRPYIITRGQDLLEIKKKAISNLRKAGFRSITLVPVLVKGVNDDQIGDIIQFAIKNKDVIRGVNFQPVSITGRIDKKKREEMRITIPDLTRLTEEQTGGLIKQSYWYPVSTVQPFCHFLSRMKQEQFVDFNAHPLCGMGTYLVIDGEKVTPIINHLDVDKTVQTINDANIILEKGTDTKNKLRAISHVLKNKKFKMLTRYVRNLLFKGDYLDLNVMHHNMLLISAMHFMDLYNFDLDRVQQCLIHYATPDGRIIPFCTYNNLYRDQIEKLYSEPVEKTETMPTIDVIDVNALLEKTSNETTIPHHTNPWVKKPGEYLVL